MAEEQGAVSRDASDEPADIVLRVAASREPFTWADVPEPVAAQLVAACLEAQSAGVVLTGAEWLSLSPMSRAAWLHAKSLIDADRVVADAERVFDPAGYAARNSRAVWGDAFALNVLAAKRAAESLK